MKKIMAAGVVIVAFIVLCAVMWTKNGTQDSSVANADLAEMQKKTVQSSLYEDKQSEEAVKAEETVAEKQQAPLLPNGDTEKPAANSILEPAASPQQNSKPSEASASSDPKPGTIAVIDGEQCMWVPGFGWVKDEGGGSQGTMVGNPGDELSGNKVGQMGGGTEIDGEGDINKMVGIMGGEDDSSDKSATPQSGAKAVIDGKECVWVPGFGWIEDNGGGNVGIVAEDMYENGNKIGIMGSADEQ